MSRKKAKTKAHGTTVHKQAAITHTTHTTQPARTHAHATRTHNTHAKHTQHTHNTHTQHTRNTHTQHTRNTHATHTDTQKRCCRTFEVTMTQPSSTVPVVRGETASTFSPSGSTNCCTVWSLQYTSPGAVVHRRLLHTTTRAGPSHCCVTANVRLSVAATATVPAGKRYVLNGLVWPSAGYTCAAVLL